MEKQIATELPDILLIDINFGGLTDEDGLMLTQHLLERFPDQKIVILSGYNLPVYRKEAKRIGARGFISKDAVSYTHLEETLRRAHRTPPQKCPLCKMDNIV